MANVDELKELLLEQLDEIESAGDFASLKRYNAFPNPGLEISGSLLPLPLTSRDAETLKSVCTQAPFGRGDETVVDESVRKTWELAASQFKLVNPAWPSFLEKVSQDANQVLGMTTVRLEPYKLLLYEDGSFFKRHKDSEKVPGMIGTLVVCLPSKHEGGDVHLSFGAKRYTFDTSSASAFDLTAMAWFSDVTHEITKLTVGYRLILIYNIIQTGTGNPSPTTLVRQQDALGITLKKWSKNSPEIERLLYVLEHKYTQSSLSMKYMKGRDHAVCHTLEQIASKHGFFLFLANLTRHEEEDEDYGDHLTLDRIHTFNGEEVAVSVEAGINDIIGTDLYADRDADSEDEGEFTGNENMPSNFRYHDTVVVMLPKEHVKQFVQARRGVAALWKMVEEDLNKDAQNPSVQIYAIPFMRQILSMPLKPKLSRYSFGYAAVPPAISMGPVASIGTEGLSAITNWAIKLQQDRLSEMAVREFVRIDAYNVCSELVAEIINEDFRTTSTVPVWDNRLSAFIKASGNLVTMSRILNSVQTRLSHEDLRQSFKAWKTSREEDELFQKPSFALSDLDFIIDMINSHLSDSDWIQRRLVPNLGNRGDKRVLCSILLRLFEKARQDGTALTKAVGHTILDAHLSELRLGIPDFPHGDEYLRQRSLVMQHVDTYPVMFLQLVSFCFEQDREETGLSLLTTSCGDMLGNWDSWPATLPSIDEFLRRVPMIFEKHNIREVEPIVKELWLSCFRKYVVGDMPTRPKPRGQTHQRRGCGPPACPDCAELNKFLDSATEKTFTLAANGTRRKHVENRLPYDLFKIETDKGRYAGGSYALIVEKLGLEYKRDLLEYRRQVLSMKSKNDPFKDDSVKAFMGDELYNELVLLSHLSVSDIDPLPIAGQKRGASSSWETSSARNPWPWLK